MIDGVEIEVRADAEEDEEEPEVLPPEIEAALERMGVSDQRSGRGDGWRMEDEPGARAAPGLWASLLRNVPVAGGGSDRSAPNANIGMLLEASMLGNAVINWADMTAVAIRNASDADSAVALQTLQELVYSVRSPDLPHSARPGSFFHSGLLPVVAEALLRDDLAAVSVREQSLLLR